MSGRRARGVRRRSWLMIEEDEFGVRGVEFEKRARSKWKCLGGCWTGGLELISRIESCGMVVYFHHGSIKSSHNL